MLKAELEESGLPCWSGARFTAGDNKGHLGSPITGEAWDATRQPVQMVCHQINAAA